MAPMFHYADVVSARTPGCISLHELSTADLWRALSCLHPRVQSMGRWHPRDSIHPFAFAQEEWLHFHGPGTRRGLASYDSSRGVASKWTGLDFHDSQTARWCAHLSTVDAMLLCITLYSALNTSSMDGSAQKREGR